MSFNEVAKQVGVCPRTIANLMKVCQRNPLDLTNIANIIEAQLDISNRNENSSKGNVISIIVIRN